MEGVVRGLVQIKASSYCVTRQLEAPGCREFGCHIINKMGRRVPGVIGGRRGTLNRLFELLAGGRV